MTYSFMIMTQKQAETIAFTWHYENEYSFYDLEADKEDLEEFLDGERRGSSVFAVLEEDELVAFLSVNMVEPGKVDIGLGMRPDLTGKGKGEEFIKAGIVCIQSEWKPQKITLSVASFNERAIKVYEKAGFTEVGIFMQETNGSTFEFLKMEYICE